MLQYRHSKEHGPRQARRKQIITHKNTLCYNTDTEENRKEQKIMLTKITYYAAKLAPRALCGDPTSIGILTVLGAAALVVVVADKCKSTTNN